MELNSKFNLFSAIVLVLIMLACLSAFLLTLDASWITNALICVVMFEYFMAKVKK